MRDEDREDNEMIAKRKKPMRRVSTEDGNDGRGVRRAECILFRKRS